MRAFILACFAFILIAAPATRASDTGEDKALINAMLNHLHAAAANADWPEYFSLYADDATFLGTDKTERWDMPTFRSYAAETKGWKYTMTERHIDLSPDGNAAWFDELLWNDAYGVSRGTGALIRGDSGWKIVQYHLTFPMPNDLAKRFTEEIQTFEKNAAPQEK